MASSTSATSADARLNRPPARRRSVSGATSTAHAVSASNRPAASTNPRSSG
jgi:hypothetical protein